MSGRPFSNNARIQRAGGKVLKAIEQGKVINDFYTILDLVRDVAGADGDTLTDAMRKESKCFTLMGWMERSKPTPEEQINLVRRVMQ